MPKDRAFRLSERKCFKAVKDLSTEQFLTKGVKKIRKQMYMTSRSCLSK